MRFVIGTMVPSAGCRPLTIGQRAFALGSNDYDEPPFRDGEEFRVVKFHNDCVVVQQVSNCSTLPTSLDPRDLRHADETLCCIPDSTRTEAAAGGGAGLSGDLTLTARNVADGRACAACGRVDVKLHRCTRCKAVWYCGAACAKAWWPQHKAECTAAQRCSDDSD
eukprot:gene55362-biopygen79353